MYQLATTASIISAVLLAVVALATAQWGDDHHHDHHHHEDYHHHHPAYKFEYGVKDDHTKDHHSAWEHRDGHDTKGEYTLDEADGTKRVVEYHVHGKSGWQPIVKRIGHAKHPHHGESYQNYNQYFHH